MNRLARIALGLTGLAALGAGGLYLAREHVAKEIVEVLPMAYSAAVGPLESTFDQKDVGREQIVVDLLPVAEGTLQPTDVQFTPDGSTMLVLEKKGRLLWFSTTDDGMGVSLEIPVKYASEEGLLGLAFHPEFEQNRRFFLNYVVEEDGRDLSVVEEWQAASTDLRDGGSAT